MPPTTILKTSGGDQSAVGRLRRKQAHPTGPIGQPPKYPILTDRDWLFREYVIKDRSDVEIGAEVGCRSETVGYWRRRHRLPTRPSKPVRKPVCTVDGCDEPHYGRGWCVLHYDRWRRHGDVDLAAPYRGGQCQVDGCDRPNFGRGWCALHYSRIRAHGEPGPVNRLTQVAKSRTCLVDGCMSECHAKGLCSAHYWRARRQERRERIVKQTLHEVELLARSE